MEDDIPKPLIEHLLELRKRLIVCVIFFFSCFIISYLYSQKIFQFLLAPLAELLQQKGGRKLIYTALTEAFLTYIKVAAFAAFFVSFPVIATQIWRFIAPGLYKNERFVFSGILVATPLLFLLGAAFAYYVIFPNAYTFFLSFELPQTESLVPIQLEAKINEYLSFVMRVVFAFGICFQLPIVLVLLSLIGSVTFEGLTKNWRFWVVGIFALSAVVTPPDVLSMVGLALPLIGLYGTSLIMVRLIEYRKNMREDKND